MSRTGSTRFRFQDDILRELAKGAATAASVSNRIASEGRPPGHGENSPELHREVAESIDHLVNLGLAEYTGHVPRTARLTRAGQDAVASLPLKVGICSRPAPTRLCVSARLMARLCWC